MTTADGRDRIVFAGGPMHDKGECSWGPWEGWKGDIICEGIVIGPDGQVTSRRRHRYHATGQKDTLGRLIFLYDGVEP